MIGVLSFFFTSNRKVTFGKCIKAVNGTSFLLATVFDDNMSREAVEQHQQTIKPIQINARTIDFNVLFASPVILVLNFSLFFSLSLSFSRNELFYSSLKVLILISFVSHRYNLAKKPNHFCCLFCLSLKITHTHTHTHIHTYTHTHIQFLSLSLSFSYTHVLALFLHSF
jgi:hypothetical protein